MWTDKDRYESLREKIPKTYALLEPRRFVLEGKLSELYQSPVSGFVDSILYASNAVSYFLGSWDEPATDKITKFFFSLLVSQEMWSRFKAPTYFLTPEIGEALVDTDPPLDLSLLDIRWPFPSIRVCLPKGLISPDVLAARYLNITLIPAGSSPLNFTMIDEICDLNGLPHLSQRSWGVEEPVLYVQWKEEKGQSDHSFSCPVTPVAIGDKLAEFERETGSAFGAQMLKLTLNIILLLSWAPDEVGEEKLLRKAQTNGRGEVTKTELWSPRFIGRPVFGPTHTPSGSGNGQQFFDQGRRGHWKRQVHGPGRTGRKVIWVSFYRTRSRVDRGLPED
jgi:hypothetical protein